MGSFNVSCGISNLSINVGDEVGFVILAPGFKALYIRSNEGRAFYANPDDLYSPFAPPIYGTYDDYGRIQDIKESSITRLLEDMFDLPIYNILKCIQSLDSIDDGFTDDEGNTVTFTNRFSDEENDANMELLAGLSGMYFIPSVYEGMKEFRAEEHTKEESLYPKDAYTPNWPRTFKQKIADFLEHLRNRGTMPEGVFMRSSMIDHGEAAAMMSRITSFPHQKYSDFAKYSNVDEFYEMITMKGVMFSASRMFMPSFDGEQDGNTEAAQKMLDLSNAVLEKRRNR